MTVRLAATAALMLVASGAGAIAWGEDGAPAGGVYVPPTVDTFHDIIERPLFSPKRRPAPQMATDAAGPVRLMGVVLLPDARYAMIKEGTAAPQLTAEGTQISSGIIEKVTADGIILRGTDGSPLTIPVFATTAEKANATAAAPILPSPSEMGAPQHSTHPDSPLPRLSMVARPRPMESPTNAEPH
ncbi:MAG TPA: hypothetical protein VGG27_18030 [Magnetospirillaceae bacterium]